MISYLSIALPIPVQKVFTYRYEHEMSPSDLIGCRALVPFGKRILTGVIVELGQPVQGMKDIIEVIDDTPFFTQSMLRLTKKMSEYYMCSWGEALKAGIPRGMTPQSVMHVELLTRIDPQELTVMKKRAPKRAALLEVLLSHSGPLTEVYLEKMLKTGTISDQLDALENAGVIKTTRNLEQGSKPRLQSMIYVNPEFMQDDQKLRDILHSLDEKYPKQASVFSHVYLQQKRTGNGIAISKVKEDLQLQSQSPINTLIANGILISKKVEFVPEPESIKDSLAQRDESLLNMTLEQKHAHAMIHEALHEVQAKTFLLHGITGSG
jgi:primosomal protein N' (replication factor Y)